MSGPGPSRANRIVPPCLTLLLALTCSAASSHEPTETTPEPGFRPHSEVAPAFLAAVGDTSIDVLPSMVRRLDRTAHSLTSQRQIVEFLSDNDIAQASSRPNRTDLGRLEPGSQWELFQRGLSVVSEAVVTRQATADYVLVMEFLVPGDQEVFGIEIYILDKEGRNAFSFLLNSHHQLFAAAELVARDSSEAARGRMIEDATRAGLVALQAQIDDARECAKRSTAVVTRANPGTLHDFDGELPSGTDEWGIPLGYSTFNGPDSTVGFTVTDSYPPRPGAGSGNRVLQIDLDVTSWGGIVNRFTNGTAARWLSYDWRSLEGLSFWFFGANSGTEMFFDIFDNRQLCSTTDDAERFRYRFWDDVAGWRLIRVRFDDLARKDIGNGAPDDGLGLGKVHGWGIGALGTGGPARLFVDDFRLLDDPGDAMAPPAERISHRLFTEMRVDEDVSRIEVGIPEDGGPVARQILGLMCECARLTVDRGFTYFRVDEREILSNGRGRFRLTYYEARPTNVPVQEFPDSFGDDEPVIIVSAAIPAEAYIRICRP